MELELEGEGGSKIELGSASPKAVFGRASLGYNTQDRTVSREHLLFQLHETEHKTDPKVSFLVIGKNPAWVRVGETGKEIEVFRRFQKGEVSVGDCFCVSSQSPVWFRLKRVAVRGLGEDDEVLSGIDPVKEFGFLIIGHEFDGYGKGRIKNSKDWDWFLEGNGRVSEDEEENEENFVQGRKKIGGRLGKRKKVARGGDDYEDEDWGGESEEDEEIAAKNRKVDRGKKEYATRSKHRRRGGNERKGKGGSRKMKDVGYNEEDAEDEDDETLGGFIVDEDEEEEEQVEEEDEEEEEFVDDDDEDE